VYLILISHVGSILDYSEVLEKYLYRIARGDLLDTTSVLPLLVKTNVYILAKDLPGGSNGSDEIIKISLPVRKKNNKNYVPVFLNKTRNSQPQPGGESHFVEIAGQVLVQSLPGDFGLIVEPMTSLEVTFTPEIIARFREDEFDTADDTSSLSSENSVDDTYDERSGSHDQERHASHSENSKIRYLRPNDVNLELQENKSSLPEEDSGFGEGLRFNLFEEPENLSDSFENEEEEDDDERVRIGPGGRTRKSTLRNSSSEKGEKKLRDSDNVPVSDVEDRLLRVIAKYPSIEEAYSIQHNSSHSEWVLGILANPWGSDERFNLVEQVAKVAKDIYGYAGAIEVYDDLYDTHSKSWDLFKMISPFYSKDSDFKASSLSQEIELDEDENDENKAGSIKDSMTRLTRSGLKFFGKS
jgi:hypothetical protein